MKLRCLVSIASVLALAASCWGPAAAHAGVDVDVHIGVPVAPAPPPPPPPPLYVVPQPESMIFVPRLGVYFAPGLQLDVFFAGGYWWSVQDGRWRRARDYRGPWFVVERRRVPRAVLSLPPDYRRAYGHYRAVPYGQWKKHHYRGPERIREEPRRGHDGGKHRPARHRGEEHGRGRHD